jgi:glycosyltransferase involved in cell wall biosynthesis
MKVLIVHNNYSHVSGPETYMHSIKDHFSVLGHNCEIFSFYDANNLDQPFKEFLPKSLIKGKNWNGNYGKLNVLKLIFLFLNAFFNFSVYKSLRKVIKFYKPDVIYLLQFHLKLSSSVIDAAKIEGVPVVCRVSDFNRLCSKNILFRDGKVCIKCTQNSFNSLRYNCLNNNFYTFLDFLVRNFDNKRKIFDYIKYYVSPSNFTKEIFEIKPEFKNKIHVIPTGINNSFINYHTNHFVEKSNHFIYFGRVSYDKGVDLIINSFNKIKHHKPSFNLKIIGEVDDYIKNINFDTDRISFSNKLMKEELYDFIVTSKFSLFYSRWFDNLPNTLIESASFGVPVIVPNFGSFKDLINQGLPCISFDPNVQGDFELALLKSSEITDKEYLELSNNSRKWILNYSNLDTHYHQLYNLFLKAISNY